MGHAFQDTPWMRSCATSAWPAITPQQVGCDHAGIATQMVVERQLEATQESRAELGREAFVERVWEWKESSGGQITQQLRRMGARGPSRERFTMDPGFSVAVQEVFLDLRGRGHHRGKRTRIGIRPKRPSDLEVKNREEKGSLLHLRYPLEDGAAPTRST